tara:strand:+ start:2154 stop:2615 length:462 start_codon:yes stop_codon:yes gene_type:complete
MTRFLPLMVLILLVCAVPSLAYAGVRCGDIEDDAADDALDAADRVDFYFDVEGDLENICAAAEAFRKWERDQPREFKDRAYKEKRDKIIASMEEDMRNVSASLTIYRAWLHNNVHGSIQEAKRLAWIRNAKNDTRFYIERLEIQVGRLKKMMV